MDGTLLDSSAELSEFTISELNRLIANGINISFATARTAATCVPLFKDVNIQIPVVLMNGVCVYDICKKHYVKTENLPESSKIKLVNIINQYNLSGFLYTIENDILSVFYANLNTPNAAAFIKEREEKYGKYFIHVDNFDSCTEKGIVYYSISDVKEKLDRVYEEFSKEEDFHVEYYRDIYDTNAWYLEVCSKTASKYNAVKYLREHYKYDYVIGFGDNLNDIPLFRASDESYAVENAKPEVKIHADGVIGLNTDNSVVKKISEIAEM